MGCLGYGVNWLGAGLTRLAAWTGLDARSQVYAIITAVSNSRRIEVYSGDPRAQVPAGRLFPDSGPCLAQHFANTVTYQSARRGRAAHQLGRNELRPYL